MKTVLTKMVPYFNLGYAEHVLITMGLDPNAKATLDKADLLVRAALFC